MANLQALVLLEDIGLKYTDYTAYILSKQGLSIGNSNLIDRNKKTVLSGWYQYITMDKVIEIFIKKLDKLSLDYNAIVPEAFFIFCYDISYNCNVELHCETKTLKKIQISTYYNMMNKDVDKRLIPWRR
ncbi:MAG: hypothetical protein WC262_11270 [Bacteroidales bacterium]|jgi:hypothetical protein